MKANIDADSLIVFWQMYGFPFTGKHNVPFAGCRALDSASLNFAFDGAVQNNLNITYFRKPQHIAVKIKTALREGETIISSLPTKAGITKLFTSSNPAEKSFESKIDTNSNIL